MGGTSPETMEPSARNVQRRKLDARSGPDYHEDSRANLEKCMSIWNKVLVGLIALASVFLFYMAVRVLHTQTSWSKCGTAASGGDR